MKEVLDLPVWVVYCLYHAGLTIGLPTVVAFTISGAAALFSSVLAAAGETEPIIKHIRRISWRVLVCSSVLLVLVSMSPSGDDYRAFILMKACRECAESDMGQAAKEALLQFVESNKE